MYDAWQMKVSGHSGIYAIDNLLGMNRKHKVQLNNFPLRKEILKTTIIIVHSHTVDSIYK